jgi:hypothetical protein
LVEGYFYSGEVRIVVGCMAISNLRATCCPGFRLLGNLWRAEICSMLIGKGSLHSDMLILDCWMMFE